MSRRTEPGGQVVDVDQAVDLAPGWDVEYHPLSEILTAETNPRDHDIPAIVRSIRRFGFVAPGMRDERTGRLVAGHGRLLALSEMLHNGELDDLVNRFIADNGRTRLPPGILVNPDTGNWMPRGVRVDATGGWLVPIVCGWSSTSDAEARAYLVADNRMTELARWDQRGFVDLLTSIVEDDPELLEAAGFDQGDLDDLIKRLEPDDLDDLAADPPDASDMWPSVTVRKVPPHVAAAWRECVSMHGDRDVVALAALLGVDPEPPAGSDWRP